MLKKAIASLESAVNDNSLSAKSLRDVITTTITYLSAIEETGAGLIMKERQRQIDEEGYTLKHDRQHRADELAFAAACYAIGEEVRVRKSSGTETDYIFVDAWPWDKAHDKRKKHDRIKQLVISGALIIAEIDRRIKKEEN